MVCISETLKAWGSQVLRKDLQNNLHEFPSSLILHSMIVSCVSVPLCQTHKDQKLYQGMCWGNVLLSATVFESQIFFFHTIHQQGIKKYILTGLYTLLKNQILILQHGLTDQFLRKCMSNSNPFLDCAQVVMFFFLEHFVMVSEVGSCSCVISAHSLHCHPSGQ